MRHLRRPRPMTLLRSLLRRLFRRPLPEPEEDVQYDSYLERVKGG